MPHHDRIWHARCSPPQRKPNCKRLTWIGGIGRRLCAAPSDGQRNQTGDGHNMEPAQGPRHGFRSLWWAPVVGYGVYLEVGVRRAAHKLRRGDPRRVARPPGAPPPSPSCSCHQRCTRNRWAAGVSSPHPSFLPRLDPGTCSPRLSPPRQPCCPRNSLSCSHGCDDDADHCSPRSQGLLRQHPGLPGTGRACAGAQELGGGAGQGEGAGSSWRAGHCRCLAGRWGAWRVLLALRPSTVVQIELQPALLAAGGSHAG